MVDLFLLITAYWQSSTAWHSLTILFTMRLDMAQCGAASVQVPKKL